MIVVVILGILAAVAIPAFSQYVKRSKTSEATENINAIYNAEVTYFTRVPEMLGNPSAQFIATAATPSAVPPGRRSLAEWTSSNWPILGFATEKSVYFSYSVSAALSGGASTASIRATGDLDGDGVTSTFQRIASVLGTEVVGGTITGTNELE